jgi:hypothetical protein
LIEYEDGDIEHFTKEEVEPKLLQCKPISAERKENVFASTFQFDVCRPSKIEPFQLPRPPELQEVEPHEVALLRRLPFLPDKVRPSVHPSIENPPLKIEPFQLPRPPEPAPQEAAMLRMLSVVFVHENWKAAPCEVASSELPRPPEPHEVALTRRPFYETETDTWKKNVLSEITSFELPRPPELQEVEPHEAALLRQLPFLPDKVRPSVRPPETMPFEALLVCLLLAVLAYY